MRRTICAPVPFFVSLVCGLFALSGMLDAQSVAGGSRSARSMLANRPIDAATVISLPGHVRKDLTAARDAGAVDESTPLRLYLVLNRTPEQQSELDSLLIRQQQPGSPDYHHWLSPTEFGERFGASETDVKKISLWLESQGFAVKSVLNNGSMIDFEAPASGVRHTFHTELRYWNVQGGRYIANAQDPSVPAALAGMVRGIAGLSKIPLATHHTAVQATAYDAQAHRWSSPPSTSRAALRPQFENPTIGGEYDFTPQDFYTVYNVNKVYAKGNLGAGASIGLPEPTDMHYGSVTAAGKASGGDVATFRKLFGIGGKLDMTVMHGAGSVQCGDPGINPWVELEATLDAEWANALAPSAHLVMMSCDDSSVGNGFISALTALIDNNVTDIISSSYGNSEYVLTQADFAVDDTLAKQAAAQGQSFIDAAGDAGSADADQSSPSVAMYGLNIDEYAGHPLITAVGGTDFSDKFDSDQGGLPQSHYWGANANFYGDARSYIPETVWNDSCADSLIAKDNGNYTGLGYCAVDSGIDGYVIGGGGGYSGHYAKPAYQSGFPGIAASVSKRATPDVSLFAANGIWGHALILCDSADSTTNCSSDQAFGRAGGTSFGAPQFAGIAALLVAQTGQRQGSLNPGLYALARQQFSASATASACYANGQTSNAGVTRSLPAESCIFHDVTTGNNDVACLHDGINCFGDSSSSAGILSASDSSLSIAYPALPGYDVATGLGSIDAANLLASWGSQDQSQALSSTTSISASATAITATQSTTIKATVTPGIPKSLAGTAPTLTGSVAIMSGTTKMGTCILSSGSCTTTLSGSSMMTGANSITASYLGDANYPASSSPAQTITVTANPGGAGCLPAAAGLTICAPAAGATTTPSTLITAGAIAGSGTLTALRIYMDNIAQATVNNPAKTASFQISQTLTIAPGSHRLVVVAYQSNGGAVQAAEQFTVAAAAPTTCTPASAGAVICSPTKNAIVSSPVEVSAGATAASGYLTALRVYVDNVASLTVNNPTHALTFSIDQPIAMSKGSHNVVVVGYQSTGAAVSASTPVTVP